MAEGQSAKASIVNGGLYLFLAFDLLAPSSDLAGTKPPVTHRPSHSLHLSSYNLEFRSWIFFGGAPAKLHHQIPAHETEVSLLDQHIGLIITSSEPGYPG
jgi:hypothetical protein